MITIWIIMRGLVALGATAAAYFLADAGNPGWGWMIFIAFAALLSSVEKTSSTGKAG